MISFISDTYELLPEDLARLALQLIRQGRLDDARVFADEAGAGGGS